MINVLHVLPRMPIGGVGSFLLNTQIHIDRDFHFDYLVLEDIPNSNFKNKVESLGSKVYLIDVQLSLLNAFIIYSLVDEFFLAFGKEYDVVHLHSANISMLILPIAKKHGVKVRILHAHATQYSDSLIKSIRNYILEIPSSFFITNRIACSRKAGDFQFKKQPYDVVYNGIDAERFKYKDVVKDKFIVGHVGNFLPQKNHDYLLHVFKVLVELKSDSELWLFGNGPLEQTIKEKAIELSIEDKVVFWGSVNNIEEYYNCFDVFLLPSLYEGFPVALVEASFCGVPAIVSNTITEEMNIMDDISFFPIDKKSVELWSKECLSLASKIDRKKKASFFKASGFNIINTTKQLEALYLSYFL